MRTVVLDASALLALLLKEPGADLVAASLDDGAIISAVNYSEVIKKMIERGIDQKRITDTVESAEIEIVPFDHNHATDTARLYLQTQEYGMSFADRACLALAISRSLPCYTAERRMDQLGLPIRVRLIRHA